MSRPYYSVILLLLMAGLSSAGLAVYAWQRTTATWALAYVAMMATAAGWTQAYLLSANAILGQPAAVIFKPWAHVAQRYRDLTTVHEEIVLAQPAGDRHFDLRISPLVDPRGRLSGRLVVLRDISERVRTESALRASEEANRRQSADIARLYTEVQREKRYFMSHELRTPLNAIIGFTRIVRRKAEGVLPEKQVENLDKVLVSADHLLGLINTILDIAKIEAGRMDVTPTTFDLAPLIQLCLTTAQPLLKSGVPMTCTIAPNLPPLHTDEDKLRQILLNLLSNAAKFAEQGQIVVRAGLQADQVTGDQVNEPPAHPRPPSSCHLVISVTDTGVGISKEAMSRLFGEFQQADSSTTRQYGGSGLGLAISRELARLLGGDLTASSTPGAGATFTLTLPLDDGKRHHVYDTAASGASAGKFTTKNFKRCFVNCVTLWLFAEQGRAMKTILIVEDVELNVELLTQLLEDDYTLVTAENGAVGVAKAAAMHPDLILMDISLPVMDGYSATREIKANPALSRIPIIALTAHAMAGDADKARAAGCDDYLTKPLDEELLFAKLTQWLEK